MVENNHGSHSFYNGYGSGKYARVVPSFCVKNHGITVYIYGVYITEDCCNRFESYFEVDVFSVRNATLYSSGVVGPGRYFPFPVHKYVVHL